jgi:hypothetical protein
VFSSEYIFDGRVIQRYSYFPYSKNHINDSLAVNGHLFEVIEPHRPVWFFLDLDAVKPIDIYAKIQNYINLVEQGFHEQSMGMVNVYVSVAESSNVSKIGAHVVFKTDRPFLTMVDCAVFASIIYTRACEDCDRYGFNKNGTKKPMMDNAVYTRNRVFRMIGQTKKRSDRVQRILSPINSVASDHLVVAYSFPLSGPFKTMEIQESNNTRITRVNRAVSIQNSPLPYAAQRISPDQTRTVPIDTIQEALFSIPNSGEFVQPYGVWFRLMCGFRNGGGTFDQFGDWNYPSNDTSWHDTWRCIETLYGQNQLKTPPEFVFKCAYIQNPLAQSDTGTACIMDVMSCNPSCFCVEEINTQFISNEFSVWDRRHEFDIIIIHSAMGTGKTHSLLEAIKKFRSFTYISVRRSLTSVQIPILRAVCPDTVNYMEVDNTTLRESTRRVIQAESLYRLGLETRSYVSELVIIDEPEGILHQLCSFKTQKHHMVQNWRSFHMLITNATKMVLLLDHWIKELSINFVKNITTNYANVLYLKNVYQPIDYVYDVVWHKNTFVHMIESDLAAGKKIFVFSNSRDFLTQLVEEKIEPNGYKIKLYNRFIDLPINDLNDEWGGDVQGVLFTPKILYGVSYTDPKFDTGYVYGSHLSAPALHTIQAMRRIRQLKEKKIFIHFPKCNQTANIRFKDYKKRIVSQSHSFTALYSDYIEDITQLQVHI